MTALFPSPAAGLFDRRLRSERGARIPVTIASGFLGAGRVVLSKIDLSDAAAIERLTRRLRVLNPRAEILTADHGAIDPGVVTAPAPGAQTPTVAITAEASH